MAKTNAKNSTVDSTTHRRTIVDVRKAILHRLNELDKSRHWLAQQTGIRTATLYQYLNGKGETSSKYVESMLSVLGMEITAKK